MPENTGEPAILSGHAPAVRSDAALLREFSRSKDPAALQAIIERHGPLVWGVCRRILGEHDAEDAFQATFLVLVRKAGAIRSGELLANWLYGVALRVSRRARGVVTRRRAREKQVIAMPETATMPNDGWSDLSPVLDDELERLPQRYRTAVLLCDVQGRTQQEVAEQLGCPRSTVAARLNRGRRILADRLKRRGVALSVVALAAALSQNAASAAVPASVASATVQSATACAAGTLISGQALSLAKGTLATMKLAKVGIGALVLVAVVPVAATVIVVAQKTPRSASSPAQAQATGQSEGKPARGGALTLPLTITGRALNAENKPVAGAEITLVSRDPGYRVVSKMKSGKDGAYKFEEVPLPAVSVEEAPEQTFGSFEVFGIAEGYALAWQPMKTLHGHETHADASAASDAYGTQDKIELDLTFERPKVLRGRIVDHEGEPIRAQFELRGCEKISDAKDPPLRVSGLESLNDRNLVPPSVTWRTSDGEGTFEFADLPPGFIWRIEGFIPGYQRRIIYAATDDNVKTTPAGWPVYPSDFEVVCTRGRYVKVRVVNGDSGQPMPNVGVVGQIMGGLVSFEGVMDSTAPLRNPLDNESEKNLWQKTDENGLVDLMLADGDCLVAAYPQSGEPYLGAQKGFTLSAENAREPITLTLNPAAVVDVTVIDADTKKPLANVDLWTETRPGDPGSRAAYFSGSWDAKTRLSRRDRARSDKNGKIRAFVTPGRHVVGVSHESSPALYETIEPVSQQIDCRRGELVAIRFSMRESQRTNEDGDQAR